MATPNRPLNLLWLQSGGCGGCTMSFLGAEAPSLPGGFRDLGLRLLWHPSLSQESGAEVRQLLRACLAGEQPLDVLCLEGAVMCGPEGTGQFHQFAGTGRSMMAWIQELAGRARYTVAVGSCAAFGGMTAAGHEPGDIRGLQYEADLAGGLLGQDYRSRAGLPVINLAGCAPHPDWITQTLMLLSAGTLREADLDDWQRPRFYADHLAHHGCPRNEYYEFKASARKASDQGCLMEHQGCKGTQAHADCNLRRWNGEGSCLRGGYACIGCTGPGFSEPSHGLLRTPKVAGIPVGLPTDMPKAWFVALATLSKSATPERLRRNAVSDRPVVPSGRTGKKREK